MPNDGPPIRFVPQLQGNPTSGEDCGVAVTMMAVDFASHGLIRPSSFKVIRQRMGIPTGPTTVQSQELAVESYDTEAETRGLRPLKMRRHHRDPVEWIENALRGGHAVNLAIDYGTVKQMRPDLWASNSFTGNHSVLLRGLRDIDGTLHVRVLDPLADGRRPEIPRGPQWWPMRLVRKAASDYATPGTASGGTIRRSEPLTEMVPPTGTEELLARIDELEAALSSSRTALRRARERITDIIRDAADAAIADIEDVLPLAADMGAEGDAGLLPEESP